MVGNEKGTVPEGSAPEGSWRHGQSRGLSSGGAGREDSGAQQLWSTAGSAVGHEVRTECGAIHRQCACSSGSRAARVTATTSHDVCKRLMVAPKEYVSE